MDTVKRAVAEDSKRALAGKDCIFAVPFTLYIVSIVVNSSSRAPKEDCSCM